MKKYKARLKIKLSLYKDIEIEANDISEASLIAHSQSSHLLNKSLDILYKSDSNIKHNMCSYDSSVKENEKSDKNGN